MAVERGCVDGRLHRFPAAPGGYSEATAPRKGGRDMYIGLGTLLIIIILIVLLA
jgi:hypothetical protein